MVGAPQRLEPRRLRGLRDPPPAVPRQPFLSLHHHADPNHGTASLAHGECKFRSGGPPPATCAGRATPAPDRSGPGSVAQPRDAVELTPALARDQLPRLRTRGAA